MLSHVFTRTGDDGNTYCNLLKTRVPKDHPIIELIGTLDEANSFIGLARSFIPSYMSDVGNDLKDLQYLTFRIGFHVSGINSLKEEDVKKLEELADKYYGKAPLKNFILPAGPQPSAALHVARTIVRRAERDLIKASRVYKFDDIVFKTINRLSSVLFAMAVYISKEMGYPEEPVSFR
ncbi:cob(I)yrinic acid a,c-diamide adenosyltransferase [Caldisphaera lagunensis]|uniref:cob(I)yrinic acid a,c-diamide adenosyltransferase n=1 Tax=Caldisphaera lagunensis TaxID=200415 RepID=UPI000ADC6CB3